MIAENWYGNEFVADGWGVENFISAANVDRPVFSYCTDANDRLDNLRFFGGPQTFVCIDWWATFPKISKTFSQLPGHYQIKIEY